MRDQSQSLANEARGALQRRDGHTARRLLLEIDEQERPWLMLAQACNMVGDTEMEEAALQAQLRLNTRDIPALILTAELKARLGDDRAASAFFQAALNQASSQSDIPIALRPMLQRPTSKPLFLASAVPCHAGRIAPSTRPAVCSVCDQSSGLL